MTTMTIDDGRNSEPPPECQPGGGSAETDRYPPYNGYFYYSWHGIMGQYHIGGVRRCQKK